MEFRGSDILNVHARLLKEFWGRHGNRQSVSRQEWFEAIADLQRMGEYKIIYSNPNITLERHRKKFNAVKDVRARYRINNTPCLACGGEARARHHIIWLKNGGRNCKRNICFLCNACHAEVHPWLKEKLKNNNIN